MVMTKNPKFMKSPTSIIIEIGEIIHREAISLSLSENEGNHVRGNSLLLQSKLWIGCGVIERERFLTVPYR